MKSNTFAEIGVGNSSFLSTEFEKGKKEFRISRLMIPEKFNGISFYKKDKRRYKFIIGIEGTSKKLPKK
jgi:hypothetical protein